MNEFRLIENYQPDINFDFKTNFNFYKQPNLASKLVTFTI